MSTPATQHPILYSFRRCPYAMRARMALLQAGIVVELREVELKNKPVDMLAISPKGTVPVLHLQNDEAAKKINFMEKVIDESRDIMLWALAQNDPAQWLPVSSEERETVRELIDKNDKDFKPWLDKYKYADRYPDYSSLDYRREAENFIQELNECLSTRPYLLGSRISMVDIAIFPFVRQFSAVDRAWFNASGYQNINNWLTELLSLTLFERAMKKYRPWRAGDESVVFA